MSSRAPPDCQATDFRIACGARVHESGNSTAGRPPPCLSSFRSYPIRPIVRYRTVVGAPRQRCVINRNSLIKQEGAAMSLSRVVIRNPVETPAQLIKQSVDWLKSHPSGAGANEPASVGF